MTTSSAEIAERLADLRAREAALEAVQASLEAQVQQLHSEEQARPHLCGGLHFRSVGSPRVLLWHVEGYTGRRRVGEISASKVPCRRWTSKPARWMQR